ncbi:hypothetical protein [Nibrella viscosa]|uniref:hypothetical protein n=1 Tax=Nibrella viscosa TaxID=1084524 RepID=UPI0031EE9756
MTLSPWLLSPDREHCLPSRPGETRRPPLFGLDYRADGLLIAMIQHPPACGG